MTRTTITDTINRLRQKADDARDDGNISELYRVLCKIDELSDEMSVQPYEFAGGEA